MATEETEACSAQPTEPPKPSYDTRAFGDFGWLFVDAGEQYRKLQDVSRDDQLMMCGIFKQATMGDCKVADNVDPKAKMSKVEQQHCREWLKHKGMDTYEAMKLYIAKVEELAKVYSAQVLAAPIEVSGEPKSAAPSAGAAAN